MCDADEIVTLTCSEIEGKYNQPIKGIIISCIKHIRRYDLKELPRDLWVTIFFYALRGIDKEQPLDICQRHSLYEYFKDRNVDDPYIQRFIKESGEKLKYVTI